MTQVSSSDTTNIEAKVDELIAITQSAYDEVQNLPGYGKSAQQLMQDRVYQTIKEQSGPLSIDRVTLDGPRDLVGEVQQMKK